MTARTAPFAAPCAAVSAALLLVAGLARRVPAQQVVIAGTGAHGAILATKDGLTLPAGEFTVGELIEATAHYLCRNYLYDAATIARCPSFTLQRPLSVNALGSEEMLYALLASRDLVAMPLDEWRGVWQVTPLVGDGPTLGWLALTPCRSDEEILRRPQLREIVMTSCELHTPFARAFAQSLSTLFACGGWRPGTLVAMAAGERTVLLHGYRYQVARGLLLLAQLDHSAARAAPSADAIARIEALERELAALKAELAALRR